MALSETAKLIAELELRDKFSGPAGKADRALSRLQRGFGQTGKGLGQVSAGLGTAAVRVAALGTAIVGAGIGLLATNVRAGIDSLRELEAAQAQTQAAITSTGGAAGQTAQEIRAMSEAFEDQNALIDDKVIQAGANVLLTFRRIGEEAFQPTLEAALDLSTALGQDLQTSVLQIGKALEDPVRGVTALRRAGVQLSEEQQKQIKILVEQNDLYGAQQIILDELAVQVGGRFAAAGRTAEARSASLRDKIEDLQQTLAKPIVPVIEKITNKLIDLFDKPATAAAASRLGEAIAGIFTDANLAQGAQAIEGFLSKLTPANFAKVGDGVERVFGFLREVPWKTIADGLRITGQAAKVAVDAFLSLPKEVQGIVIGALAINKLSGGLVGTGIGTLGKGLGNILLGGGLLGRGSSPANALWVQSATGIGGGGPGVVGAGGIGGFLRSVAGITLFTGVAVAVGEILAQNVTRPADPTKFDFNQVAGQSGRFTTQQAAERFAQTTADRLGVPLDELKAGIVSGVTGGMTFDQAVAAFIAAVKPKVTPGPAPDRVHPGGAPGRGTPHGVHPGGAPGGGRPLAVKLPDTAMSDLGDTATATQKLPSIISRQERQIAALNDRMRQVRAAQLAGNSTLGVIAAKKSSTDVSVTNNVTVNLNVDNVLRKITSTLIASGKVGAIGF